MAEGDGKPDPYADMMAKLSQMSSGNYMPAGNQTSYTAPSGLSPNQQVWQVYMGGGHDAPAPRYTGKALSGGNVPGGSAGNIMSTDKAMGQFYGWTPEKRHQWGLTLQAAGLIAPGDFSWDSLEGWWQKAVGAAGNIYTLGGQSITPEQWIKTRAMGGDTHAFGDGTPSTHTYTTKTIPYQDPASLRELIRTSLADKLGQAPDDAQMNDMMDIARQYEAAHPGTQQSTVHTDAKGNQTTTNKTITAGASQAGYQESVDQAAMQDESYGSYQASAPLFNAFLSAIQAPTSV